MQLIMGSSRDLQFDGLKFILIFLVVLGHLTFNDYGIGVKRMVFSFHMPAFIFLSGYFTSLSSNKDRRIQWLKQTLILLFFAHVTQYLLLILMGLTSSLINDYPFQISSVLNRSSFIEPAFTLWYLVSLIYWRIATWIIGDKVNDIALFVVSCIVAILVGFIPLRNEFSFQRTFSFAPFFVLGVIFKKRHLISKLEKVPILLAIVGFVVGLLLAREMPIYYPVDNYTTWGGAALRTKQMLLALFLCLLVVRVSRCKFSEYFARFGSKTLWIYIGHAYLIIIGHRIAHFLGWSISIIGALFVAAFYCTIIILVAYIYTALRKRKAGS